ncbi:MAG: metallophosphoesterase [Deltaproteobacteria bacterium]|nr:metallophosphoesterase [bacterium]MCB9475493.1 metallophosphoesterase [Deltaproteobacteria bacterium]MCB9488504.1 metallophosphoesterase [Deltaproteobacteria bacterium]
MRRIKLVVSDLHLGKGVIDEHGHLNVYEDFREDDKFVEFLNHYGGRRHFHDEVELIINGDFFELLVVDAYDQITNRETEQTALWKMHRIFAGHPAVFDALWTFSARPNNKVTFLIGNHDASLLWSSVQKLVKERIGPQTEIIETPQYDIGPIHIEHGNHYEWLHAYNPRNFAYLNERGERVFRMPWGSVFVVEYLSPIKKSRPYVDKVRPFSMYMKYAFVNDHVFFWRLVIESVRFWLRNRFSRDPVRRREFALNPRRMMRSMSHDSMDSAALHILENTRFRYVIFGHSHKSQHRRHEGYGEYINSGTWTENISLVLPDIGRRIRRTYVWIDFTDEDNPVVRLKEWHGSHREEEDVIY